VREKSDYELSDVLGKLKLLQSNIETTPADIAREVIAEAVERMERITVIDEEKWDPFVYQIKFEGEHAGHLAIGTGANLLNSLLALGISHDEATEVAWSVASIIMDDVPVNNYKGSNFRVSAQLWMVY
jgi:hypothetical protein